MSSSSQPPAEKELSYQTGFGNEFQSSSLPDSLPQHQNNPVKPPHKLYTEQISGTAFTKPRNSNLRTWVYRMQPSVSGTSDLFQKSNFTFGGEKWSDLVVDPNPIRWSPIPDPTSPKNFVEGVALVLGNGDPSLKEGIAIYLYAFNEGMTKNKCAFYNSDGDFLIVPQRRGLTIKTELGILEVEVGEICVVPRGIVFCVDLMEGEGCGKGYILEIFRGHFELPELGPIGANGLANPRDFMHPTAAYDPPTSPSIPHKIYNKFQQTLFHRRSPHSPFNVVSWHGSYVPFKYSLRHYCTINSVSYDHPDPSIYTVLTAKSDDEGTALADFVIFPPRWMVMERTFRPPYFHRNCMTEFMGMVEGKYDAKEGFVPGGASLHSCMTPHGPDKTTWERFSQDEACENPEYFQGGLAFMFETNLMLKVSPAAVKADWREEKYAECWDGLENRFDE